jgi:hypothetical protein
MPGRLAGLVLLAVLVCGAGSAGRALGRAAPVIFSIVPPSGPVGTTITITGANFTADNNTVRFGGGFIQWLPASSGGSNQTIVFTLRPVISGIACPGTARCPTVARPVRPGDNALSVRNANGTSSAANFTVTD